jgi:hypothetical protein
VPISVIPRVVFGVPLDPSSLGPDAFRLWSGELKPGGTVSYDFAARALSFRPSVTLRTHLAYAARLADNVRGIDGSVPDGPVEIVFVTGTLDAGWPPDPPPPTFDGDVAPLVEARCGVCHGTFSPRAGLVLWPDTELLAAGARESTEWYGWPIVAPGSPERSYLMYKITGSPGLVGVRMPAAGAALTYDEVHAVERWIDLGARR